MCESSVFVSQTSNGIGHGAGHSPLRGYLGLFLTLRVTLNCKNVEFRKSEWNLCGQIIQCCVCMSNELVSFNYLVRLGAPILTIGFVPLCAP